MTTLICQQINVKPCVKHGLTKRNKNGECKKCCVERVLKWVEQYPEKYKAKNKRRIYSTENERSRSRKKYRSLSDLNTCKIIRLMKVSKENNLTNEAIPQELVELKRLQLKLLHAIKHREKLETML